MMSSSPSYPHRTKESAKLELRRGSYWARGARWLVGALAALLLMVSVGNFFYHRDEIAELAADHLRLLLTGPAQIGGRQTNLYTVLTTDLTGRVVPADLEFELATLEGQQLFRQKERTGDGGMLNWSLPVDLGLPAFVRLQVKATRGSGSQMAHATLAVNAEVVRASPDPAKTRAEVKRLLAAARQPAPKQKLVAPRFAFYPEGGHLVAGVRNRVYFTVRGEGDQPLSGAGTVIDAQDTEVADWETSVPGIGRLAFTPAAGQRYRLRYVTPSGQSTTSLPTAVLEPAAVLTTGASVFTDPKQLDLNILALRGGLPLVVTATAEGKGAGQAVFVTAPGATNDVRVPLGSDARGLVRLAVFDYRSAPPKLVSQRYVYRAGVDSDASEGDADEATTDAGGELAAWDLVLGTAGTPYVPSDDGEAVAAQTGKAPIVQAPAMFDNLPDIRARYEEGLSNYRAQRTRAFDTLTSVSFFGGFALVVLVGMLALLGVITSPRFWLPALLAAIACVLIGAVVMNPSRWRPTVEIGVPFANYQPNAQSR